MTVIMANSAEQELWISITAFLFGSGLNISVEDVDTANNMEDEMLKRTDVMSDLQKENLFFHIEIPDRFSSLDAGRCEN